MSLSHIFYGGNGTMLVDSGLPRVGVIYGVSEDGDLLWYRYNGNGEKHPGGYNPEDWHPNSGHSIAHRPPGGPKDHTWHNFRHIFGCGDGVILGVRQNGELRWYKYDGDGEEHPGDWNPEDWHPNSGNIIGKGWHNFRHVFVTPREGWYNRSRLTVYGVEQNGDLRWYSYDGNGEEDTEGIKGWHPNSGHIVRKGLQNVRHIFGSGGDIFGVDEDGNLRWYSYHGHGGTDDTGIMNWHPESGKIVDTPPPITFLGWQIFRAVFGGADNGDHVIYGALQNGDLLWYRYDGDWHPNSGNVIGNGW